MIRKMMRGFALTIRNLPPEVLRLIRQKAQTEGISLNRAVAELLAGHTGKPPVSIRVRYHDLDGLAGSWSADEASAFGQALAEQRGVDPELWR